MGKEPLILILEDCPRDVELIERELRRGGLDFVVKRLRTEEAFTKAVRDSTPDLILADYKLPDFDGLKALEIAREQCPDVPFVLISGVCGEELAIEALKRGATDYILKERLYRLAPAVRQALGQAECRRAEREARETEKKFFALTETLPAIVFVHQDGKFRYLNPAAEGILGYSTRELLNMDFWEVVHPDSRETVRARGLGRQQGRAVPGRYEFQIVTRTGETRWLDCTATRIEFEGRPAVLGSALDITERLRAEEALRQSEAKSRALLDAMPDFILRFRREGSLLDFTAPKDPDLPANANEVLNGVLSELTPAKLAQRTSQSGGSHAFEFQFPLRAEQRDFEARVAPSGPDEILVIVRDVTERKRLEKEVLEISAHERRHFGYDLHDGLGQYLAGVAIKAKILEDDLARESLPHKAAAKQLVRLINNAIGQVRSLARGLAPIEVEVTGLVPALQKLARDTEDRFGVVCHVRSAKQVFPVSKSASLQLYRIVQEAITNAIRHGHAERIEIDLATEAGGIRLSVKDDGRGFRAPPPRHTGMGLRIMEHRAHAIGGVLKIDSHRNRSTEIQCFVPLAPAWNPGNPEAGSNPRQCNAL